MRSLGVHSKPQGMKARIEGDKKKREEEKEKEGLFRVIRHFGLSLNGL